MKGGVDPGKNYGRREEVVVFSCVCLKSLRENKCI